MFGQKKASEKLATPEPVTAPIQTVPIDASVIGALIQMQQVLMTQHQQAMQAMAQGFAQLAEAIDNGETVTRRQLQEGFEQIANERSNRQLQLLEQVARQTQAPSQPQVVYVQSPVPAPGHPGLVNHSSYPVPAGIPMGDTGDMGDDLPMPGQHGPATTPAPRRAVAQAVAVAPPVQHLPSFGGDDLPAYDPTRYVGVASPAALPSLPTDPRIENI